MIPYERHEAIMNLLREKKYVRTEQLSKALYVSVATIRRDLAEMEKNGFLQRVSGGARVIEEPKDRPVEYMVEENVRKKKHIARLASRYLRDDHWLIHSGCYTAQNTDTTEAPLILHP